MTRPASAPRPRFEELSWAATPAGELTLRRRVDPATGADVVEVKLGEEFLMSSAFTVAEEELARLALARLTGADLTVVVGGLGLGHTARAVLDDARVADLLVVEALPPVIQWHRDGLVPLGASLTGDPRCRLALGDFFARAGGPGLDPDRPGRLVDAVLVDIDHTPAHHLSDLSGNFYSVAGTERLARHLRPGGVYALWSNDPPEEEYLATMRAVLDDVVAEVVTFPNPLQDRDAANTVYLGTARPRPPRDVSRL